MPAGTERSGARRALLSAAACAMCALSAAHAEERPVWELGLGVGLVVFNDYRGANTSHAFPVPVPYFIYRGHFLKSDRDGTRAQFFTAPRVEFNLSVSATTPVRNNSERVGMPDLKSTLEAGGPSRSTCGAPATGASNSTSACRRGLPSPSNPPPT